MDKLFNPTLYQACNYLYMLGLKFKHVSKEAIGDWFICWWSCVTSNTCHLQSSCQWLIPTTNYNVCYKVFDLTLITVFQSQGLIYFITKTYIMITIYPKMQPNNTIITNVCINFRFSEITLVIFNCYSASRSKPWWPRFLRHICVTQVNCVVLTYLNWFDHATTPHSYHRLIFRWQ